MKKLFLVVVSLTVLLWSCRKDNEEKGAQMPENFMVDVPQSLSDNTHKKNADTIKGNEIYQHMRFFIRLGEVGAEMVQAIMRAINQHDLSKETSFTFTSDDDGREKKVVVVANATYGGATWEYGLTLTDQDQKGLQVFWNSAPVKGIAILQSSVINFKEKEHPDLRVLLEYTEGENGFDQQMVVAAESFKLNAVDQYSMDKVKMWVGKKGEIVEVQGNSNHPYINFNITDTTLFERGRNWAFTARGNQSLNIGVAQVALPPSSVATTDSLMTKYSMYNVLRQVVLAHYPQLINYPQLLEGALTNAQSPGYFDKNGFLSSGSNKPSTTGFTDTFVNITGMLPYAPKSIRDMQIDFGQ